MDYNEIFHLSPQNSNISFIKSSETYYAYLRKKRYWIMLHFRILGIIMVAYPSHIHAMCSKECGKTLSTAELACAEICQDRKNRQLALEAGVPPENASHESPSVIGEMVRQMYGSPFSNKEHGKTNTPEGSNKPPTPSPPVTPPTPVVPPTPVAPSTPRQNTPTGSPPAKTPNRPLSVMIPPNTPVIIQDQITAVITSVVTSIVRAPPVTITQTSPTVTFTQHVPPVTTTMPPMVFQIPTTIIHTARPETIVETLPPQIIYQPPVTATIHHEITYPPKTVVISTTLPPLIHTVVIPGPERTVVMPPSTVVKTSTQTRVMYKPQAQGGGTAPKMVRPSYSPNALSNNVNPSGSNQFGSNMPGRSMSGSSISGGSSQGGGFNTENGSSVAGKQMNSSGSGSLESSTGNAYGDALKDVTNILERQLMGGSSSGSCPVPVNNCYSPMPQGDQPGGECVLTQAKSC